MRGTTIQLARTLPINDLRVLTIDAPNKRRITLRGSGNDRVLEMVESIVTLDGFAGVPVDKEYRLQAQTKQAFLFEPQTFVAEEQIEYADFAAQ